MSKRKKKNLKIKNKKSRNKFKFQVLVLTLSMVFFLVVGNFILQIFNKPTELISFMGFSSQKAPKQTWEAYGPIFRKHSTETLNPQFLAAMAQVESAGNPLASPGWKFSFSKSWKNLFSPASSSVGLFQFTSGTYQLAKKYCIHKGQSIKEGPWFQWKSCWFNFLYSRIWPSHSIEMASAFLDYNTNQLVGRKKVSRWNKRRLAAVIHLCGIKKGKRFLRAGFKFTSFQKCGSHSVRRYVQKIENLEKKFQGFQIL